MKFALIVCFIALSTAFPQVVEEDDISDKRIRGGEICKIRSDFPFAVSLVGRGKGGSVFNFCAGAIMNEEWILTAAHCFNEMPDGYKFAVMAGILDITDTSNKNMQLIPRKSVHIHEKYDPEKDINDIAMVQLESKLQFNENVQPIPVCKKDQAIAGQLPVYGWGATTTCQTEESDKMKHTKINKIDDAKCVQAYGYHDNTRICTAGDFPNSVCQGDSGGSLILKSENGMCTLGPLSFGGDKCGVGPTVFTYAPAFKTFIDKFVK